MVKRPMRRELEKERVFLKFMIAVIGTGKGSGRIETDSPESSTIASTSAPSMCNRIDGQSTYFVPGSLNRFEASFKRGRYVSMTRFAISRASSS